MEISKAISAYIKQETKKNKNATLSDIMQHISEEYREWLVEGLWNYEVTITRKID